MYYVLFVGLVTFSIGCSSTATSNTARTGVEQMLISNAVDRSLNQVDFKPFGGKKVFLDSQYVDSVDKNYLVSSVRHRLLNAGATVTATADDADVVLEARAGAIGTDSTSSFIGTPEIALPGMLSIPEIRLAERNYQSGIAKIGFTAYDAKSNQSLGQGGVSLANSDKSNWFMFGIGPYQNGSVKREITSAKRLGKQESTIPQHVVFNEPIPKPTATPELQLTKGGEVKIIQTSEQSPGNHKLMATPIPDTHYNDLDDAPPWPAQ